MCHKTRKTRQSVPAIPGLGTACAELKSGVASPMVALRQPNSFVSTFGGNGTGDAFAFVDSAAVLLYPSSVRTTLLAR